MTFQHKQLRGPLDRCIARLTRCLSLRFFVIGFVCVVTTSHAEFIGFFDHSRGAGTHQYTLSFFANTNGNSGLFTNISDGVTTPVRLTSTVSNGPTAITTGSQAGVPAPGTPAYETFNGYVDFATNTAAAIQVPTGSYLIYTFSNLNPNLRYVFKGCAVRGTPASSVYTNRWTKVTILGADSAAPRHTSNAVTSAQAPADLGPQEAAFMFGQNYLPNQGDVAVWEDINPGADGVIQIVSTRYTGFVPNGGSSTTGNPPYGYAISGIRLEEVTPSVIAITSGPSPASLAIEQGQSASFSVQASGTSPRYEWFRDDGQPIVRAVNINSSVLTITNVQSSDAGLYRVRVTNSISSITSGTVRLSVNADRTPPSLIGGLGFVNGSSFVLDFSEPLNTARSLSPGAFHIHLSSGGGDLAVASVVFTNGTNLYLSTSSSRLPDRDYSATVDASAVYDLSGNAFTGGTTALAAEVALLSFTGTPWKYNADGLDLSVDWYADPGYDDSAWLDGFSVFDGKTPQPPGRMTVGGFPVATQLPLTNDLYPSITGVIPTYYYRTHFNLATTTNHVLSLKLRTLIDDFEDFFLNGQEAYRNPGYPATNPPPAFGYAGGTAVGTASVLGPYDIPATNLAAGDNIAAVIVNQVNGGSSDTTFAYELIATIDRFETGPRLAITRDSNIGTITLTWPAGSGAQLYEAPTADATVAEWNVVTAASDGSYSFTPSTSGGTQQFFTLRR